MSRQPGIKREISVQRDQCGHYDFGLFETTKKIKVNKYWWSEYVKIRQQFEIWHQELIKAAERKNLK